MIEWLKDTLEEIDHVNDPFYSLEKIKEKFEVKELCEDGWLVLNWDEDKFWLNFAVMDFYQSDLGGKNMLVRCIFHGEGPSGSLRECRHTYWGEEGYVFYPNKQILIKALEALEEFFDFD